MDRREETEGRVVRGMDILCAFAKKPEDDIPLLRGVSISVAHDCREDVYVVDSGSGRSRSSDKFRLIEAERLGRSERIGGVWEEEEVRGDEIWAG